ncbi:MAG: DNA-binding protein [Actinomycetia bacterium]|nr:DNA-binding protein [Actinomycetes bacterium]
MKEYEFGLRFSLLQDEAHSDELIERLGDAGCDDALIGIGHAGRIALEFAREADSAYSAILSAIRDVKRALPAAELVEVSPDLVGVSDVADIVGCSRQNLRKLLLSPASHGPTPLHEGKWEVWHLAPVLRWLVSEKHYTVSPHWLEISEATMKFNAALDAPWTDAQTQEDVQGLVAR